MLQLTEHRRSEPVRLTRSQQLKLRQWFDAKVEPDHDGMVRVIPGARVGAALVDGLEVAVRPKVPVRRILQMLEEITDPHGWLEHRVAVNASSSIEDAVGALFVRACQQTFRNGLLHAYRRTRQDLGFVRGKVLIPQTLRRFAPVPVAVETDVFDDDNDENRVLRSALQLVRTSSLMSERTRNDAHRQWREVRHLAPLRDPLTTASEIIWTRHNLHYEQAIRLAALVLASGSVNLDEGAHEIPGIVLNMPQLVEQWVRSRLRHAWAVDAADMPDSWKSQLWLDAGRRVELQPDLGIRTAARWVFVGDVKYKVLGGAGARREDVYQLNAYLTATGLPDGVLVYVGVSGDDETLAVGDVRIHVVSVDLAAEDAGAQLLSKLARFRPARTTVTTSSNAAGV